jgi:hypothetical protein
VQRQADAGREQHRDQDRDSRLAHDQASR